MVCLIYESVIVICYVFYGNYFFFVCVLNDIWLIDFVGVLYDVNVNLREMKSKNFVIRSVILVIGQKGSEVESEDVVIFIDQVFFSSSLIIN